MEVDDRNRNRPTLVGSARMGHPATRCLPQLLAQPDDIIGRVWIENSYKGGLPAGGSFTEWCVGTARDWHSPVLEAHEREDKDDHLICREAYTPVSARSVRLHFVNDCGSSQTSSDASDDGKLVFADGAYMPQRDMCAAWGRPPR